MALDLSRVREAVETNSRLGVFAEFLNVLENVAALIKVDCSASDVEFTRNVIMGQRRLEKLCEAVYARLVEAEDLADSMGLLNELEQEVSAFEAQNVANKSG